MVCIDTKPLPLTKGKVYEIQKNWSIGSTCDPGDSYKYYHGIVDEVSLICDDGVLRDVSFMRFREISEMREEKLKNLLS